MTFQEQIEDLIRYSKVLKEERDSDFELASIDKNLNEAIDSILNNKIDTIFKG